MSRNIAFGMILVCGIVLFGLNSCQKDVTAVIEATGSTIPTDKAVSFAGDIVPIFSKSCSISGCHASGGKAPDLSDSKAFSSLSNGGYINLATPKSSKLYLALTGKNGIAMPVGAASNPSNINNLVLAWIQQGGKNN